MTDIHGTAAPGYETVAEEFANAFSGRPTMGAALAIRRHGKTVVDLWGGTADARTGEPWERDTATVVFSCTKGLVSILAARLVQEGRLSYDAHVSDYWPEFAAAGKQDTTVSDLLSHRAGLSALHQSLTVEDIIDWERTTRILADAEPLWRPGSGYAYHAITHGWLAGEVIRRVAGVSVGQYFQELACPWSRDAWIGLPASEAHRVAHTEASAGQVKAIALLQSATTPWPLLAMTLGGALPAGLIAEDAGFNNARIQAAEIPGAGGIATARALASIWSATVLETDGELLLEPSTLDQALRVRSEGEPVFPTAPPWSRWGAGFQLDSEARRYLGPESFGHDGAGGQVAFADRAHGIGFAFNTNFMEADDDRASRIITALGQVLKSKVEG